MSSIKELEEFNKNEWRTIILSLEYQRRLLKGQIQHMKEGKTSDEMELAILDLEDIQLKAEVELAKLAVPRKQMKAKQRIVKFMLKDPVLFFASWLGLLFGWALTIVADILMLVNR
jgi:hypothetical protein